VGDSGTILQSGTFTHAAAPTITTQPASDLTWRGATLCGTANPNSATTSAWFEYGLTTSYGSNTIAANIGSGPNLASLAMPWTVSWRPRTTISAWLPRTASE
jgi:hypothetical protein